MRIALVGFGGVGKALVKLLSDKKKSLLTQGIDIRLNYVINSREGVYDPMGIDCGSLLKHVEMGGQLSRFTQGVNTPVSFETLLKNRDVDVMVEATPTNRESGEPGLTHIRAALENGINVVTANKGPILLAYRTLNRLAVSKGVHLCAGCTTGGALPTINAGIFDLAGSNIHSIEGILNGTTNYILGRMEQDNLGYEQALSEAQRMGIAETDPSLDVEGWDTAIKLLILVNILMNEQRTLDGIRVEGITRVGRDDILRAKKEGKTLKLIGRAVKTPEGIDISINLEKIGEDNPLSGVNGTNKAVRYVSDSLGDLTIIGGASGTIPAAASLLRDIINLGRGYRFSV